MKKEFVHLARLSDAKAREWGNRAALRSRNPETGKWEPVSWKQLAQLVDDTACALLSLGVKPQENMAVFSQNMVQGIATDLAAFALRAVTVPLYATSSLSQLTYIVHDAQIRYIFVGEQLQYDVAFQALKNCPTLEGIIIFDKNVTLHPQDYVSVYFDDFVQGKRTDERMAQLAVMRSQGKTDDIANILYTSGTTGEPKGVVLPHSGYLAQFQVHCEVLPQLSMKNQVSMNFLPLTHVFERAWTFMCLECGITVCVNTDPKVITTSLKEVRPTMMCSVPRFWEKVYDGVQAKIASMTPMMQKVVNEALKVGHEYHVETLMQDKKPALGLTLKYKMYEKTVFQMLKKAVGIENGVMFPTAGAAIPRAVEEFMHSCGIPMVAGYGLTESTATVSCDWARKVSIGSCGRPLPGVVVKIGENNEVLIKGPNITPGYYKKDSVNAEAFDQDGFFHTGDAGFLKDGELFLTERIKDLYKTSNGKYIAPQMLEGLLGVDKFIDQLAIIADMRKYVTALIIPVYPELKKYADANGIAYAQESELLTNPEIVRMLQTRIDTLQQGLAHYEQVKRFTLLPEPFSLEKGELTNTLKMRRPVILEHYKQEIEKMYE